MTSKVLISIFALFIIFCAYDIANAIECEHGKLDGAWSKFEGGDTWVFKQTKARKIFISSGDISCIGSCPGGAIHYELFYGLRNPNNGLTIVYLNSDTAEYTCDIIGSILQIGGSKYKRGY